MTKLKAIDLNALNQELTQFSAIERLKKITETFESVALATSFGKEDQILTEMIVKAKLKIDFFTLDTGRLFEQTYQTWQKTLEKYAIEIKAYYPDSEQISAFTQKNGPNSFYHSIENRKECCRIRKIVGLKKALKNYQCWIVGLRSAQSENREKMPILAIDQPFGLYKLSPILEWSESDVDGYAQKNQVPINPLHQQGFVSIGCAPCTRAIKAGEDFRAGRWWWEQSSKECGLHQNH